MKRLGIFLILCGLLSCGSGPVPEAAQRPLEQPPPRDESHRFPKEGLVSASVAPGHILDRDDLPGGNVAVYERDGKRYKLFLITLESADKAALLLYDIKSSLADAKFVPTFGGYFGVNGDEPWFIFGKKSAVAGIVGLPQEEADQLAREFAARME